MNVQRWRIEDKHTGAGWGCEGCFADALAFARAYATSEWHVLVVWESDGLGRNRRVAEVNNKGARWVHLDYRGHA